jgi:hypothetical protein
LAYTNAELLSALKQKVRVNKTGGFLEWLHDGRGPAMRRGEPVEGSYIVVLGHRVEYKRAAWALLTGQMLGRAQMLDTSLGGTDWRTWRVVERTEFFRAKAAADGALPQYKEWINYQGKKCKPSKTQRTESDSGWEKPYTEQRAA